MVSSPLGREIMADVLVAAAEVLRRDREGTEAMARAAGDAAEAGADLAVSAAETAQLAAGALARMAMEAVGGMMDDEPEQGSKRNRSAKTKKRGGRS